MHGASAALGENVRGDAAALLVGYAPNNVSSAAANAPAGGTWTAYEMAGGVAWGAVRTRGGPVYHAGRSAP